MKTEAPHCCDRGDWITSVESLPTARKHCYRIGDDANSVAIVTCTKCGTAFAEIKMNGQRESTVSDV